VTDEADSRILSALQQEAAMQGAVVEIIAPMIGGVKMSDGTWVEAHHKVVGGPSVLFDAVALLTSKTATELLTKEPGARDFVADAFAHVKFIGYSMEAKPLLEKAGIADSLDEACVALTSPTDARKFIKAWRIALLEARDVLT